MLAIGLAGAPAFARLTQTLVAGVAGARLRRRGPGRRRRPGRGSWSATCCPNIAEPLVVNATIGAGGALLAFAGLSFLGLGVQPPAYDWGRLLFDGIGSIYVNPAAALAPGAAVLLAGLAFNLFGESVAKGLGVGVVAGIPAAAAAAGRARDGERRSTSPHRAPTTTWCSTSATSRSPSPGRPGRSARCAASPSPYAGARPSASWASPAPASR